VILGLGIDLVEVARVESLVARYPARAAARLFTEGEWTYASTKARPALHLAARFAAKEAAFKALAGSDDARAIGWREIEVVRAADGAPADGTRAHQLHLVRSAAEQALSAEARSRRDDLERRLSALRTRKDKLPEVDYLRELESILLALADVYQGR